MHWALKKILDLKLILSYFHRRQASELRRSRKGVSTGEPNCLHFITGRKPVMHAEDTWMTPNKFAFATMQSRKDVAFDTGLYNYYDRKFGDYRAAIAELIRP